MNVLLIDDEINKGLSNVFYNIKKFFKNNRDNIHFEETAESAINYLEIYNSKVDLAIIDQLLSGSYINGIELAKKITEKYPQIALVMLTANPSMSLITKALRMGFCDFLDKSNDMITKDAVFESLHRVIHSPAFRAKQKAKSDKLRADKNLLSRENQFKDHQLIMTEIYLECMELVCRRHLSSHPEGFTLTIRSFSRALPLIEKKLKDVLNDDTFNFQYFANRDNRVYRLNKRGVIISFIREITEVKDKELWDKLFETSSNTKSTKNMLETFFKKDSINLEKADILLQKFPDNWKLTRQYYANKHFQDVL